MSSGPTLEIELRGELVLLEADRALVWPARRTLVIADPHFGKDDIFRRGGIALPRGPTIADLQRVSKLLERHACTRLCILGDFVHGATKAGDSFLHAFRVWREAHPALTLDVVAGNHDRHEAVSKWQGLASWHAAPLIEPPFVFAHHPGAHAEGYVLAGHIHPVVRLPRTVGGGRVPVFWQRVGGMVLPSFGSFTGGAGIEPGEGDRVYVAGPERVLRLVM